jgi:D-alanine-D-alanine ligase
MSRAGPTAGRGGETAGQGVRSGRAGAQRSALEMPSMLGTLSRERPIVVLFGGPSAEHDVSIVSGTAIADALRSRGWSVRAAFIDLAGRWWWLPADHRRAGRSPSEYDDPAALGAVGPEALGPALTRLAGDDRGDPLVFIALHGPFGEDGTIQGCLDAAGIAYTGAGVAASAVGMDKALFKRLARGIGLPVVDWLEVGATPWRDDRPAVLAEIAVFAERHADERLMVKPARLGSSVGMTLAHDRMERPAAIDLALRYDTVALVERYVPAARDLEVAILGNDPEHLAVFGPGEIHPGHEFYDYVAKYGEGVSTTTTRAEIPSDLRLRTLDLARRAYLAIGAVGFARVDFLLAGQELYVGELNTIPGFTPISLFPTLPAEAGLDYADVCEWVVALALQRAESAARRPLAPEDLPR